MRWQSEHEREQHAGQRGVNSGSWLDDQTTARWTPKHVRAVFWPSRGPDGVVCSATDNLEAALADVFAAAEARARRPTTGRRYVHATTAGVTAPGPARRALWFGLAAVFAGLLAVLSSRALLAWLWSPAQETATGASSHAEARSGVALAQAQAPASAATAHAAARSGAALAQASAAPRTPPAALGGIATGGQCSAGRVTPPQQCAARATALPPPTQCAASAPRLARPQPSAATRPRSRERAASYAQVAAPAPALAASTAAPPADELETPAEANAVTDMSFMDAPISAREARAIADGRARMGTPALNQPAPSAAAATTGTLRINSRPWALLFIDGVYAGTTPQLALHIRPGEHSVRLVNTEFGMTRIFSVELGAGETITRIETLGDNSPQLPRASSSAGASATTPDLPLALLP